MTLYFTARLKRQRHRQVVIKYRRRSAKVDKGIAPLILALWQRGFWTISSCERDADVYRVFDTLDGTVVASEAAWVGFRTLSDAKRFRRLSRGRLVVPAAEDFEGASEESFEAGYSVPGMAGVMFSFTDIHAVLEAVRRSGRRPAKG